MRKYLSVFLGACLCLSSITLNATPNHEITPRINDFITELKGLQKKGLLDGEVLIAQGDNILLDLKSNEIRDLEPQFMIGSVSKQFYAVALLKSLYDSSQASTEENKISDVKTKLHMPIATFLPAQASVWNGEMPSWAHTITLHQLLTHTSGLFNYSDSEGFEYNDQLDTRMKFFEYPHSAADIIALVAKTPLEFDPGSRFAYSNTGYMLIAEVIESLTKMPVSEYLNHTLFKPLGLASTTNPNTGRLNDLSKDPLCRRLVKEGRFDPIHNPKRVYNPLHHEDISVAKGAASIVSTANDLLKWNQALHKHKTVLPESLYQLLITENLDGYAYGLGVQKNALGLTLGHSGVIGAYRTHLLYAPNQDISIIVLSNISYDWHKTNQEIEKVASSMGNRVSNEDARFDMASQLVMEHHHIMRGHEYIMETLHAVLN